MKDNNTISCSAALPPTISALYRALVTASLTNGLSISSISSIGSIATAQHHQQRGIIAAVFIWTSA